MPVQTYWQLAEIEAAFRSLKGEAGLRPIFHVKPSRIRAHLFLAVLAYHGVHLLRKRLAPAGRRSSWETIRRQLADWVRLTASLRAAVGSWIQCRQDSCPDAKVAELARAIGLTPDLHLQVISLRKIRHGPTSTVVGRVLLAWSLYDARSKCV